MLKRNELLLSSTVEWFLINEWFVYRTLVSFNRSYGLIISTESYWLHSFQPDDGLWYRPKYCISGIKNITSRLSLNLEFIQAASGLRSMRVRAFDLYDRTLFATQSNFAIFALLSSLSKFLKRPPIFSLALFNEKITFMEMISID